MSDPTAITPPMSADLQELVGATAQAAPQLTLEAVIAMMPDAHEQARIMAELQKLSIDAEVLSPHALEKLEIAWNERAKADKHFKDVNHPINFNPGIIKGGDWASSVPAWCDVDCRIAVLPGWSITECQKEILACVSAAARAMSVTAPATRRTASCCRPTRSRTCLRPTRPRSRRSR